MKRYIAVTLILTLTLSCLAGCAGKPPASATGAASNQESQSPISEKGDLTLNEIRMAAEDSGFTVTDDYIASFMKDVTGGFSVEIVADEQDVTYSVLECKTEEAAILNAKDIDEAGYNIAIRNGRFMTCYGVDKKDGTTKDILVSILNGKAV